MELVGQTKTRRREMRRMETAQQAESKMWEMRQIEME